MNSVQSTPIRSTRRCRRRSATLLLVTLTCGVLHRPTVADPLSDVFQPDALRTGAALRERTPGLTDPRGRDCELPGDALSFAAAVDLALCRNPATRSAWATARQQAAALGSAESAWLPSITATDTASRDFGNHEDTSGGLFPGPQNTEDAAANLSWVLYDFGARGGRIASARHLLDAAAATASSVSQQTVLNVVQSYYGVVAAEAGVVAARTTESNDARSFEVARSLREGGAGTRADVLQAETAFDQSVLARIQAEAAAKTAHGTLAVTLGLPADQTLTLAPDAVPAEAPALTARMADLMAEAMRQRPDLAAARAQRDSAEANITVARAAGRPSVSISAGHHLVVTTDSAQQNYSLIGVNVTVPIFTGFNVDYGVRQAQAALEASEADAERVRLGVTQGVWNAYYALESANQQLTVTTGLTQVAEENQQVALGRYQAGVGSIVDVLTAQTAASLARVTRINAELGWQVARAQLALALGRLTSAAPLSSVGTLP